MGLFMASARRGANHASMAYYRRQIIEVREFLVESRAALRACDELLGNIESTPKPTSSAAKPDSDDVVKPKPAASSASEPSTKHATLTADGTQRPADAQEKSAPEAICDQEVLEEGEIVDTSDSEYGTLEPEWSPQPACAPTESQPTANELATPEVYDIDLEEDDDEVTFLAEVQPSKRKRHPSATQPAAKKTKTERKQLVALLTYGYQVILPPADDFESNAGEACPGCKTALPVFQDSTRTLRGRAYYKHCLSKCPEIKLAYKMRQVQANLSESRLSR